MEEMMRRDRNVTKWLVLTVGFMSAVTPAFAGPAGNQGDVLAKYYSSSSVFQIDANQNFVWDGTAGGDASASVAPAAGAGTPLAGNAGAPCKQVGGSSVFCDANRNGVWNGNAGGDLAATFASGAGSGTILFADLNTDGTDELVKFYGGVGATNFFQADSNQNNVWNGTGGGDKVFNVAPSVAGGVPFICDCDGNGTIELGKYVAATSEFYIDLNNNGVWNGNGGGDRAGTFAAGAGAATSFLFANLSGAVDSADELIKFYGGVGATNFYQIDANNNFGWNGTGGGDAVGSVAPAAAAGAACAIDLDGNGTSVLCKTISGVSSVFADLNGNLAWDGNAGGDKASTFAQGAGPGAFVILKKAP
jgi:hypothetical protein